MLQASDLACVRGDRCLFQGLALALEAGQCLHVAGANGAGKTSLLRILAGLLPPTEGSVRWNGESIATAREEYAADLAFVGHLNGIKDDLSVLENVRFEASVRGSGDAGAAARVALAALELQDYEPVVVRHLSQGQRRRVALARLCVPAPARLWILDEPFNALDVHAVGLLQQRIDAHLRGGGMVVLTAHQAIELPAAARRLELDLHADAGA
jgi:heme exporter protein A